MATNMFVTNIPNGTSIQVMRGTAIHLAKQALSSKTIAEDGSLVLDYLKIWQLAGAIGISREEAREICVEVVEKDLSVEEVIDRYAEKASSGKKDTFAYMKESLSKINR